MIKRYYIIIENMIKAKAITNMEKLIPALSFQPAAEAGPEQQDAKESHCR